MTAQQATAEVFLTAFKALPRRGQEDGLGRIARDRRLGRVLEDISDRVAIEEERGKPSRPLRDYVAERERRERDGTKAPRCWLLPFDSNLEQKGTWTGCPAHWHGALGRGSLDSKRSRGCLDARSSRGLTAIACVWAITGSCIWGTIVRAPSRSSALLIGARCIGKSAGLPG
jgi:hypothetical protein